MVARRRLLLGGALTALGEAMLGVVAVTTLGPLEVALYVLACAAATAGVTVLLARLTTPRRRGDAGDERPSREDPPPPWWPGFERDFWHHVRDRDRAPA